MPRRLPTRSSTCSARAGPWCTLRWIRSRTLPLSSLPTRCRQGRLASTTAGRATSSHPNTTPTSRPCSSWRTPPGSPSSLGALRPRVRSIQTQRASPDTTTPSRTGSERTSGPALRRSRWRSRRSSTGSRRARCRRRTATCSTGSSRTSMLGSRCASTRWAIPTHSLTRSRRRSRWWRSSLTRPTRPRSRTTLPSSSAPPCSTGRRQWRSASTTRATPSPGSKDKALPRGPRRPPRWRASGWSTRRSRGRSTRPARTPPRASSCSGRLSPSARAPSRRRRRRSSASTRPAPPCSPEEWFR
mmetsp:Transcript_34133/g.83931  ORF Transcript_34133/g.83931 Transcript_34133/m.83931 type:complete len:300 (-) Transcript_34133:495-1394(-)